MDDSCNIVEEQVVLEGFHYLVIPDKYYSVYIELLKLMSNVGVKLLNTPHCDAKSKLILRCWDIFNCACCANSSESELKQHEKGDYMVNYIIKILNLKSDYIIGEFNINFNENFNI